MNNVGPRTEPWGTPLITGSQFHAMSPKTTRWRLLERKAVIHFTRLPSKPYFLSLRISRWWETLSKAFAKSENTMSVGVFVDASFYKRSLLSRRFVLQALYETNPCCCGDINLLDMRCEVIELRTIFSMILHFWINIKISFVSFSIGTIAAQLPIRYGVGTQGRNKFCVCKVLFCF